ncbi:MAG: radical SAM family heme chaperone HemW [Anaerolineae bacterium]|nr:radical SAM family heme chaperone HemW [Anaerolineae bacterium]
MVAPNHPTAVYVHVPFCRARCAYCDFATTAGLEHLIPAYVAAVCREIEAAGARWGRLRVPTLYIGGGTPSLVPPADLEQLLDALRAAFRLADDAEVTLEANPGTLAPPYLAHLRDLGVNRLSLGVQSAHAGELQMLGRIHTWAQAVEAVSAACAAGFDNLSLDLIYGLPRQALQRWEETLRAALALAPQHLSLYALTVETGTPLAGRIARGTLPPPDDDLAADMVELAEALLAEAGYFHYEISNWARSDQRLADRGWQIPPDILSETVSPFVCRHNLVYWRNAPYLGFGAGAASWFGGERWVNVDHPQTYIDRIATGASPVAETEHIPRPLEMGETMMMGLRLAEGVSDARFRARFGASLEAVCAKALGQLSRRGLLSWDGRAARLTAQGRLLGNQVFAHFLPPLDR